jgi:adhesin/invasin
VASDVPAGVVLAADGTAEAVITVELNDAFGNATTGAVVISSDLGSVGTVTDLGGGTYQAAVTSGTAGTATIAVTGDGTELADSVQVEFVDAVSSGNSSVTGNPTTITTAETSDITVVARDASNNLIRGATVTLSSSGSDNTFAPSATLTTDANGQAVFTFSSTTAEPKSISATISAGGADTNLPDAEAITVNP